MSNAERIAVLLTGYGGVEKYKDFTKYNKRASDYIAAKFAPLPHWIYPVVARILTLQNLYKWGYEHEHFTSPQNEIFEQQRAGVERHLQERWGERIQAFKAFYFCEPFTEEVLREIRDRGFEKLLIYPLLVVNSVFTSTIAVEQLNQVLDGIADEQKPWLKDLRYIPSFSDRPAYIDLMVRQVEDKITKDLAKDFAPSRIGIVLLVHGGPQKSKGLVTGVEDGQILYNRVQEKLIDRYPLISIGWINHKTPLVKWSEPNLKQAGKNLIELGAKVIIFKSIGWATENVETILDVEEAIDSLHRQHPEIAYIQVGSANDHPDFLKMAAEWANPQIEALLSA